MSDRPEPGGNARRTKQQARQDIWLDRLLVILSMGLLIGFCGIIVYYVAEPDLAIIVTVCLALALHDFWSSVFQSGPDNRKRR